MKSLRCSPKQKSKSNEDQRILYNINSKKNSISIQNLGISCALIPITLCKTMK